APFRRDGINLPGLAGLLTHESDRARVRRPTHHEHSHRRRSELQPLRPVEFTLPQSPVAGTDPRHAGVVSRKFGPACHRYLAEVWHELPSRIVEPPKNAATVSAGEENLVSVARRDRAEKIQWT